MPSEHHSPCKVRSFCLVQSREVWVPFLPVFGMTQPGIEPTTSHSQGGHSTTGPLSRFFHHFLVMLCMHARVCVRVCVWSVASLFFLLPRRKHGCVAAGCTQKKITLMVRTCNWTCALCAAPNRDLGYDFDVEWNINSDAL